MKAIYKRELGAYFKSLTGPVFIALFLAATGVYTAYLNLVNRIPSFELSLYNMSIVFLIAIPLLTMHSFAQERRQNTDKLLYSSPVRVSAMVAGKYFAMLTVFAAALGICCLYPLVLSLYGKVPFLLTYSYIFIFFLMGAAFIAIGMFLSTLTSNQFIAAAISFCALLFFYMIDGIASIISGTAFASLMAFSILALLLALILWHLTKNPAAAGIAFAVLEAGLLTAYFIQPALFEGAIQTFLSGISLFSRSTVVLNGIFDLGSVVCYLSVIALFLFLSVQSVEKRRWS